MTTYSNGLKLSDYAFNDSHQLPECKGFKFNSEVEVSLHADVYIYIPALLQHTYIWKLYNFELIECAPLRNKTTQTDRIGTIHALTQW